MKLSHVFKDFARDCAVAALGASGPAISFGVVAGVLQKCAFHQAWDVALWDGLHVGAISALFGIALTNTMTKGDSANHFYRAMFLTGIFAFIDYGLCVAPQTYHGHRDFIQVSQADSAPAKFRIR